MSEREREREKVRGEKIGRAERSKEDREKLAMTADVIGSGAIRRDDGCLTGARSLARQAVIISNGLASAAAAAVAA